MINDIIKDAATHMKKAIEHLDHEFSSLRSGRAHASLVDTLQVDYYGSPTPLKQIANISTPEARLIVIQPWDRNAIGEIEKAIMKSSLSVTPSNDGHVVRINLPVLTEEQRKEMVKIVHKKSEDARVAIRNIRREANEKLEKEKKTGIPEDEIKRATAEIQKSTDGFIKQVDDEMKVKEKEIMTV